jgi:hypothetical protein
MYSKGSPCCGIILNTKKRPKATCTRPAGQGTEENKPNN